MLLKIAVITVCGVFILSMVAGSNILGIFPFTAKSHFVMFESLLLELHKRQHNLTIVSHFPQKTLLENFTDISLRGVIRSLDSNISLSDFTYTPFGILENLYLLYEDLDFYEPIFRHPPVQSLLKTNTKFDLIITEIFNTDMFLGIVGKFKSPFIALSASPLMPWAYDRVSNIDNPSYIPNIFSPFDHNMDFLSRFFNFWYLIITKAFYFIKMSQKSEAVVKDYFSELPPLLEIANNVSLILVNTHFSLHQPAPLSRKVIEVGGMHIKEPNKLEANLEKFITRARHGVILFSMGSMFRSESISMEKLLCFQKVFEKLPQQIIWKWESSKAPNTSKNIMFMNWLPQRDILAHPNVKLFIYHGGLLGISEAVYCGVPILGIPLFGDMSLNIASITLAGAGETLSFWDITEQKIYSAINKIISNQRYKTNAMQLSKIYKDRPMSALETAVYWTEYVIRHQGAPQLNSASLQLKWYKYYLVDVILLSLLFISAVIVIICIMMSYFIKRIKLFTIKTKTKMN